MPLFSISVKGEELQKDVVVKLERGYEFTELKLLHVYHNIDSQNITANSNNDATQQCQLFIKLGGLIENHSQIINYTGSYDSMRAASEQNSYNSEDYQVGASFSQNNANSVSVAANSANFEADIDTDNLIPIGASRHNTAELISRDVFKDLHKGSVLSFNGELHFGLHYMNSLGVIVKMTAATGGILATASAAAATSVKHVTSMTLIFSYEE